MNQPPSVLLLIYTLIQRDLKLSLRRQGEFLSLLFFFVMVVSLFPFGIGPEAALLRKIAPGVLWVAALLANLLALPRLFADDFRDGSLEQLALLPRTLGFIVFAKVSAHWLLTGLPLVLLAPLLGLQFDLPNESLAVLAIALLIGTPALSGIGAIGAALTLGVRGGGMLLSLLVLPLYIPVLIFGAGAVDASLNGMAASAHYALLGAMSLAATFFAPWPTALALRIALE